MAKIKPPVWAGVFDDPQALLSAARQTRDKGFEGADAFTPYPVHGLEKALGLKRSWVPYATLVFGLGGATLGYLFMYWTSVIDWPVNIGGKPMNSWPAFVPIVFECGVLLGGLATFVSLLVTCGLPNFKPFILDPQLTNNRFALVIPEKQDRVREDIENFLKSAGAIEVKRVVA